MTTSYYSEDELKNIGFKECGENVFISRYARIYGASRMVIGNNVRVDDFCILSGSLVIGNYVHIAAYVAIFAGEAGVIMGDYSGISSRSVI